LPSALLEIFLGWADEVVDVALHHRVVGPRWGLVQIDIEVWWKEANGAAVECPQVIDDQAFIAAKIMLSSRRQNIAYNFGEHQAEGIGSVEV
jgi:hypothetical protein